MKKNVEDRKAFWKETYPTLKNWKVVSSHSSKAKAQEGETILASHHGCDAHPGGRGPENETWLVYHFEY
jgi:hypothetical protein